MKKVAILSVLMLFLAASNCFAWYGHYHQVPASVQDPGVHNRLGAKVDAPHLIGLKQISKHFYLGIEGGKDIASDLFYPDDYGYYESDRGWFGYLKVTYENCLFNCP